MSCEKYREMISAGLDGELSQNDELSLREHLASCSDCRRLADELASMSEMNKTMPAAVMPEEIENRIKRYTVEAPGRGKSWRNVLFGYYRVPRGLVWAGMAAVLFFVGDTLVDTGPPPPAAIVQMETVAPSGQVRKIVFSENDIKSSTVLVRSTQAN